jgi:hypothetical protein
MAYTIKRTDGTILLTLSDSRVDQLTTSVTLIGKNVDSYGEYYNDNLVGLLENFSSTEQPRSPLVGQLWHNRIDGRIYVYGLDNLFSPVAATSVSPLQPTNLNAGDLWIDSVNKQLYFTPDGVNFTLAGPQYSTTSGKSGWLVETITDSSKTDQVVASLYNKDVLLGIASSKAFTFDVPSGGMSSVQIGFNLNQSIAGIRFVGTATSADSVQGFTPGDYLNNIGDQILSGGLKIVSDSPGLQVGSNTDLQIYMDSQFTNFLHNPVDKRIKFWGYSSTIGPVTPLIINFSNSRVGINTVTPGATLDVNGDVYIGGNLTVVGASTNVQSVNLQVNDKNIDLAYGNTLDTVADGGGITLKGTSDHTIVWKNDTTGWNFNTNTNLTSADSSYQIAGSSVIRETSLGEVITDAPGMRRMGILESLTVTNVLIHDSTVQTTGTNKTLYLTGTGVSTVDVVGNRISSVAEPVDRTDSATKGYVDDRFSLIGTKGFVFSMDVTAMANPDLEIISYLNQLLPITNSVGFEYLDLVPGTRCRVLCGTLTINIPASPTQLINLSYSTTQVKDISNNTQTVVKSGLGGSIPSTTQIIPTTSYAIRQFSVSPGLVWQFDGLI